jgi:co-chaperonin GroES (HSP10)
MSEYVPQPGFAAIRKKEDPKVKEANGLLFHASSKEESILRGSVVAVCNVSEGISEFETGDDVVVCPKDVIGSLIQDGKTLYIVKVESILGKVIGQ